MAEPEGIWKTPVHGPYAALIRATWARGPRGGRADSCEGRSGYCGSSDFSVLSLLRMRKPHRRPPERHSTVPIGLSLRRKSINCTQRKKGRRRNVRTGYRLRGRVGPQGELAMRAAGPGGSRPIEINFNGSIDNAGTARGRQISNACNYDFIWQK